MSNSSRKHAVDAIARCIVPEPEPVENVTLDDYAGDVFDAQAMQKFLSKDICRKLLATIENDEQLDPAIAGDVAHGMK